MANKAWRHSLTALAVLVGLAAFLAIWSGNLEAATTFLAIMAVPSVVGYWILRRIWRSHQASLADQVRRSPLRQVGQVIVAGILLLPLGFCVYSATGNMSAKFAVDDANRAHAERIISALAAYQRAHHRYPATLDALQPTYLRNLPAAGNLPVHDVPGNDWLRPFTYEVSPTGGEYALSYWLAPMGVAFPSDDLAYYSSTTNSWITKYL